MTIFIEQLKYRNVKFIYSEKATKFCKISSLLLSYVVPVKSKLAILQNFVAFSEYMNFNMPHFKDFSMMNLQPHLVPCRGWFCNCSNHPLLWAQCPSYLFSLDFTPIGTSKICSPIKIINTESPKACATPISVIRSVMMQFPLLKRDLFMR